MRWIEGPDGVWRPERPGQCAPRGVAVPRWLPAAIALAVAVVTVIVRSGR